MPLQVGQPNLQLLSDQTSSLVCYIIHCHQQTTISRTCHLQPNNLFTPSCLQLFDCFQSLSSKVISRTFNMPFKAPECPKCPKCSKSVFAAEEMLAAGSKWHKGCFKCDLCHKRLDSTNATEHGGALFCKQCYGRKFGPKGYGFGGGAGCLSMDSGAQFGNTETASNKPQTAPIN